MSDEEIGAGGGGNRRERSLRRKKETGMDYIIHIATVFLDSGAIGGRRPAFFSNFYKDSTDEENNDSWAGSDSLLVIWIRISIRWSIGNLLKKMN